MPDYVQTFSTRYDCCPDVGTGSSHRGRCSFKVAKLSLRRRDLVFLAFVVQVSGLKYGTKYNYRVFAENAAGISDPSNIIGPLLADNTHGETHQEIYNELDCVTNFFLSIFTTFLRLRFIIKFGVNFIRSHVLLPLMPLSASIVGPTFDLSAFKDGLEVIVPQPLTIRVPITGYPTPTAKWTFADKELSSEDERIFMMTKSTYTELVVSPSVRPDKGTYMLQLENDVTSVSGEINVNVIGTSQKMKTR